MIYGQCDFPFGVFFFLRRTKNNYLLNRLIKNRFRVGYLLNNIERISIMNDVFTHVS